MVTQCGDMAGTRGLHIMVSMLGLSTPGGAGGGGYAGLHAVHVCEREGDMPGSCHVDVAALDGNYIGMCHGDVVAHCGDVVAEVVTCCYDVASVAWWP